MYETFTPFGGGERIKLQPIRMGCRRLAARDREGEERGHAGIPRLSSHLCREGAQNKAPFLENDHSMRCLYCVAFHLTLPCARISPGGCSDELCDARRTHRPPCVSSRR